MSGPSYLVFNTAAAVFARGASRMSGLIFVPIVAHSFGSEALGAYQLSHVLVSYGSMIALFGLGPLAVRELALRRVGASDVFAQVLGLRLPLALLALTALACLVFFMDYPPLVRGLTAVLSLNLLFAAVQDTGDVMFQGGGRMYYSAFLGVGAVGLYAVLGLVALALGGGMLGLAAAYTISMLVRTIVTLALVRKWFCPLGVRVWGESQRRLFLASVPFFIGAMGFYLVFRVDVLILSALQPLDVVGWYLASYLFLEAAVWVPVAFGQAIYPLMGRAPAPALNELTGRGLRVVLLIVLPIPGLFTVAAPDLVNLLFGRHFGPAIDSARVLIWSLPFFAYSAVVGKAIVTRGGQARLMRVELIGLACNILSNLALVPHYGLIGAAVSTVGTYALIAVLHGLVGSGLNCTGRTVQSLRFAAPALASWAIAWVISQHNPWISAVLVGMATYLVGVVIVGSLGPGDISRNLRDLFTISPPASPETGQLHYAAREARSRA